MARGSESLLVISPLLSTRALLPFQASVSLFRQGYKQSHDRCWDFKAVFNGQENTIKQTEHDDRGGIWEREQREICQKKKFILKIVLASTSMPYWKDTSDLYYGLTKTWLSYFIMCSGLHLSNNSVKVQHALLMSQGFAIRFVLAHPTAKPSNLYGPRRLQKLHTAS